jgi:hypothetical protein
MGISLQDKSDPRVVKLGRAVIRQAAKDYINPKYRNDKSLYIFLAGKTEIAAFWYQCANLPIPNEKEREKIRAMRK